MSAQIAGVANTYHGPSFVAAVAAAAVAAAAAATITAAAAVTAAVVAAVVAGRGIVHNAAEVAIRVY